MNVSNPVILGRRKIVKKSNGNGYLLTVPPIWAINNNLQNGGTVILMMSVDGDPIICCKRGNNAKNHKH
jgi:hypothetical protein